MTKGAHDQQIRPNLGDLLNNDVISITRNHGRAYGDAGRTELLRSDFDLLFANSIVLLTNREQMAGETAQKRRRHDPIHR